VFTGLEEALDACGRTCATYEQAMPLADRVYATHVQSNPDGDAFFPRLDETVWQLVEESNALEENGFRFRFKTYERAG
jgi:dihydrofolate reductase